MTIDDLPFVLTVEQTAEFLGIGRGLAFKSVREGSIPSLRIGRRILVPREALRTLLEKAGTGGDPRGLRVDPADLAEARNDPSRD